MFVVRKFDCELPFSLWLDRLSNVVWSSECEACIFAWRRPYVADCADRRASAGECLAREELLEMTAHTGIVIGKVSHVRKGSFCRPFGRNFMASIAGQAFVFFG